MQPLPPPLPTPLIKVSVRCVQVSATDRDLGVNGQLAYSLSPQSDHADVFLIDADTGQIYIRSALDYERNARYHLTVMACDGAAGNLLQDDRQKAKPRGDDKNAASTVHTHIIKYYIHEVFYFVKEMPWLSINAAVTCMKLVAMVNHLE